MTGSTRGVLIAFEGIDGCGKSTQLALFAEVLREADIEIVTTAEPTDGAMGRRIRAMARSGEAIAPAEELRWFTLDRREHVATVIEPALARGEVVLTDRYTLSSVAYQGARAQGAQGLSQGARRLSPEAILRESEAEFPIPDLALVFTLPAEAGLARTQARGGVAEPVFERVDFLGTVAAVFAGLESAYIERIDATGDVGAIQAEVVEAVRRRLGLPR